jgi:hypothetical protein
MAVSHALRRLLRIRDLEEEQHRLILESAMGELRSLENALAAATARRRRGRELAQASACAGESTDRQAGMVETDAARRYSTVLTPRIATAQDDASRLRQEFLVKRVERLQAETLIEETESRDVAEAGRRSQQALDEWYRSRLYRQECELHGENAGARNSLADDPLDTD